ncbi:hypothetical protein B484DRAFT_408796 [Ochromonadaceae sp. CCMP2298]|nr:hypothetical protein B484DRAFT_408796 [Ochromonadaceae sp. CCMP2298]
MFRSLSARQEAPDEWDESSPKQRLAKHYRVYPDASDEDCITAHKEIESQRVKWTAFLAKRDIWTDSSLWQCKHRSVAGGQNRVKKKFMEIFDSKMKAQRQLKALIRGGVPPELRGRVWFCVSGASDKRASAGPEEQYGQLLVRIQEVDAAIAHDIEKDVFRTFPERVKVGSKKYLNESSGSLEDREAGDELVEALRRYVLCSLDSLSIRLVMSIR